MKGWFWRWIGLFQALFLLGAIGLGIPALINWDVWNGLDLGALILFFAFLWSVSAEQNHDRYN